MKLWSNSSVPRSANSFNPERRLLAAVLQRAITDYVSGEGELQDSARIWLYSSDDPNEAFGFTYICEALDFHQEELRKAVHRQYVEQCEASGKVAVSRDSLPFSKERAESANELYM